MSYAYIVRTGAETKMLAELTAMQTVP